MQESTIKTLLTTGVQLATILEPNEVIWLTELIGGKISKLTNPCSVKIMPSGKSIMIGVPTANMANLQSGYHHLTISDETILKISKLYEAIMLWAPTALEWAHSPSESTIIGNEEIRALLL